MLDLCWLTFDLKQWDSLTSLDCIAIVTMRYLKVRFNIFLFGKLILNYIKEQAWEFFCETCSRYWNVCSPVSSLSCRNYVDSSSEFPVYWQFIVFYLLIWEEILIFSVYPDKVRIWENVWMTGLQDSPKWFFFVLF